MEAGQETLLLKTDLGFLHVCTDELLRSCNFQASGLRMAVLITANFSAQQHSKWQRLWPSCFMLCISVLMSSPSRTSPANA
jgi:hypothetical protein